MFFQELMKVQTLEGFIDLQNIDGIKLTFTHAVWEGMKI